MATNTIAERRLRQLLKELRKEQGLTQVELGRRIGQSQQFVSMVESGDRRLYATQLVEIVRKGFRIPLTRFAQRYEKTM